MADEKPLSDTNFIDIDEEDLEETSLDAYFDRERKQPVANLPKRYILSKERYDGIIGYVQAGCYPTHAAMAVGVPPSVVTKWMSLGEEFPDSIYGMFNSAMLAAFGSVITTNEMNIQSAAMTGVQGDWKASDRILQVYASNEWGKDKCKVEISGPDGLPIQIEQKKESAIVISNEELMKMLQCEAQADAINALPSPEEVEKNNRIRESIENATDIDYSLRLGSESEDIEEY